MFTLKYSLLPSHFDRAIILQSVRFNNQCYWRTHWKWWRWLLTWQRNLHLFLPQKHTAQLSRALHSRNTSDGIKTPLQWLQRPNNACISWNRLWDLGNHNYQIPKLTDIQCDLDKSTPSQLLKLFFCDPICFCIAYIHAVYATVTICTVGSKSDNTERCSYYAFCLSLDFFFLQINPK